MKERILTKEFESDLIEGKGLLKNLLAFVRMDNSLDLQIRGNYINIYYRGGNILKVCQTNNSYNFQFDFNYLKSDKTLEPEIKSYLDQKDWLRYFAFAKQAMDFYATTTKRSEEREHQQLIVRDNNYSTIANCTDYFIVDVEYDNRENAKFDIVAIEWLSQASKRKLLGNHKPKLVIIEMKYGDKSLSNKSGMAKHYQDYLAFKSITDSAEAFKNEMINLFKQKRRLGIIPCLGDTFNKNSIEEFDYGIDFAFLISNHDPESSLLSREINQINSPDISYIVSNFCGYGLYKQGFYQQSEFQEKFSQQI